MFQTRINWKNEIKNLQQMSNVGGTFVTMAEHYGVSKQRIKQIFQKYHLDHVGLKLKKSIAKKEWDLKWGNKTDSGLYDVQRVKYRAKKHNAIRKGVPFTILFGEIEWPTHCPVLGLELDYFAEVRQENSISFDQIDPNKGYVKGNVQIISWRANRIKNDGSEDEHRRIADWLASLRTKTEK